MNLRSLFARRKQPRAGPEAGSADPEPSAPVPAEMPGAPEHGASAPETAAREHNAAPASVGEEEIVGVLRTIYDPEIPVNIYEMGLIYGIDILPPGNVVIRMTLTSPGCPVAASLPMEVENRVLALPGVTSVYVELVWDPPWTPERMSEAARLQLGMM